MTHQRTDRIYLAADVARCTPQYQCPRRDTCARYLAALPPKYGTMIGSDMPPQWTDHCWHYISVSSTRAGAPKPQKPAHKPVRGIA